MELLNEVQEFAGEEARNLVQSLGPLAVVMRKYPATTANEELTFAIEQSSKDSLPLPDVEAPNKTELQEELAKDFQKYVIERESARWQRLCHDQPPDVQKDQCLPQYGSRVESIEKLHFLLARHIISELIKEQFDQWRDLRGEATKIWRREQFLNGSPDEIIEALYWMAEQGGKEYLILLLQCKASLHYASPAIQVTIRLVEERMRMRIYHFSKREQVERMRCFRLFCSPSQLEQLPDGVYLLEVFPTFSLISIAPDLAPMRSDLQGYTVEALESLVPSATLPNPLPGGKPMPMRDYIVRLLPQADGAWRKRLEEAGAQLLQPLGGTGYLDYVVMIPTADAKQRVDQLPEVHWMGSFQPQVHVNRPRFQQALSEANPPVLLASFFTAKDRALAEQQFEAYGIEIIEQVDDTDLALSVAQAVDPEQALDLIIAQLGLRALEEEAKFVLWNDVARHILKVAEILPSLTSQTERQGDPLPLTGRGEIIAIADSGLDTGDKQTIHLDLRGRVRDYQNYHRISREKVAEAPVASKYLADFNGHGTHVVGSALGSGTQAQLLGLPPIKGTAPEAELLFQAIGHGLDIWDKLAVPRSLGRLFAWAYERGARIHSNSWGSQQPQNPVQAEQDGEEPDRWTRHAEQLDKFVWTHRDFLVVVAAGNAAQQFDHHQSPSQKNVSSPGIAKNCLTVGACEHERPNLTVTYGLWHKKRFPFEPAHSHQMTDSTDHLASFSSRGPVEDPTHLSAKERRKPDVLAPGTFILSTRSSQLQGHPDCWGAYLEGAAHYLFMSGTSMATPLVAGGAALVRQYLREYRQITSPSAALLKAAIIHSAQYLGQTEPQAVEQGGGRANDEQGWGLVKLGEVLAPVTPKQVEFLDEATSLYTGQDYEYQLHIADDSVPLRITLVYSDDPASLSLVNNLNLWVCDPQQNEYFGNDFEGTLKSDANNNVEGVFIPKPIAGEWKVRVRATKVASPEGQDYALVLSGNLLTVKSKGIVKSEPAIS